MWQYKHGLKLVANTISSFKWNTIETIQQINYCSNVGLHKNSKSDELR